MQKIIVLDDNDDILEAVSLVLKRKFTDDVVSLNEPTLLEKSIPANQPALLLMDIFIGRYDGRKICRMLKDNPLFDQLAIILFSAQSYTAESVTESGADAVLDKPFSINSLTGVIEKVFSNQH
jgi:CheY-like chemotaxis protein